MVTSLPPFTADYFKRNGYVAPRQLPDGRWIGLMPLMTTVGLCIDLDRLGHEGRYCYREWSDALHDLTTWGGEGDPPGPWIKKKGRFADGYYDDPNPSDNPKTMLYSKDAETEPPSIVCPKCGMRSFNRFDMAEGYCGMCHDWTGKQ